MICAARWSLTVTSAWWNSSTMRRLRESSARQMRSRSSSTLLWLALMEQERATVLTKNENDGEAGMRMYLVVPWLFRRWISSRHVVLPICEGPYTKAGICAVSACRHTASIFFQVEVSTKPMLLRRARSSARRRNLATFSRTAS